MDDTSRRGTSAHDRKPYCRKSRPHLAMRKPPAARVTTRDSPVTIIPQPEGRGRRRRGEAEPEGRGGTGAGEPPPVRMPLCGSRQIRRRRGSEGRSPE